MHITTLSEIIFVLKLNLLSFKKGKTVSFIKSIREYFKSKIVEKISVKYWCNSKNSYIGTDELYTKQAEGLKEFFIPRISLEDTILDIGCSDGRFSFLV